jgi:lipoprotein|nr:MAG TPA: TRAF PROTEIN, TRAO PROTEIN, TRAN ADHESION, BACTERIAL SECRETION.5A [Caudoviricetes sp.]
MKKLLILLAFLLAGCEATDIPKTEICKLTEKTHDIETVCIEGFKFIVYSGYKAGGVTQFLGADSKPVTCSCGGK